MFVYVQERTRSALLETLYEELHVNSQCMMGLGGEDEKLENGGGGGGGGFFESFKVCLSKYVSFLKLFSVRRGNDPGDLFTCLHPDLQP